MRTGLEHCYHLATHPTWIPTACLNSTGAAHRRRLVESVANPRAMHAALGPFSEDASNVMTADIFTQSLPLASTCRRTA